MKKIILGVILLSSSMSAYATAPGGPDCGWGNMAFEGKSGTGFQLLATFFNNTSGNKTFGMSSGTNGCKTSGVLSYGGENFLAMTDILTEFTEDVARGEGEALNAVAVMFGIPQQERAVFAEVAHANFDSIFPSEQVTAKEVLKNLVAVMKTDQRLVKYTV